MNLFDTTLRDGGNVVGDGFSCEFTESIVKGLLKSGIKDIELGNSKGLGAYEQANSKNAPSDEEYFKAIKPYLPEGHIGMFMLAKLANADKIKQAASEGLNFLRVGANATDGKKSLEAIKMVKNTGMVCRYSLMKAYVSTPEELAEEAKMLEDAGVDIVTIMDSAGYMFPEQASKYVKALKSVVSIPVGFHGHSNLGLSQANALAAVEAGAEEVDCGLLGMARSAGNCSTELAVATLHRKNLLLDVDLYTLLEYLDEELIPMMSQYKYKAAVNPLELILGFSGCHSSFTKLFRKISEECNVNLYKLIVEVSKENKKVPTEELMRNVASNIK